MKKLILLGLILAVSLLGIYLLTQNQSSDGGGLFTPTKPSEMMLNILNIYGTLEDYSTEGNMTTFRIRSEVANCRLNNSNIEVTANTANMKELYLIESYNFTSIEQLDIGKPYNFYPDETHYILGIYNGTFTDTLGEEYISLLDVARAVPFASIHTNFTRAEYVKSTLLANSSFFAKNEKYMFYFHKKPEERLSPIFIEKDNDGVRKQCSTFHERDLTINQMIETIEPKGEKTQTSDPLQSRTMVVQIITTKIESGKPTELKIGLINKQNNDISYIIKGAKLVNEQASQWYGYWYQLPPYEERLKNAVIADCSVNFDSSESSISANSTKILSFTVNCPRGIDVTKTYEICDNYEEKRNCRMETANRTDDLMLWGEMEFTDELGIKHTIPNMGVMKQTLELQ